MSQAQAKPEYEVLTRTFIEPHTLEPGTRIIYEGVPGTHLRPLNSAAEAKMEEFFTAEFPAHDPITRKPTGEMIRAREGLRPTPYNQTVHQPATITALPEEAPSTNIQSLAEIMAVRKPTDQRPPPAPTPKAIPIKTPEELKNG